MGSAPKLEGIKALLFDVFGTVVDWRGTVTKALDAQNRTTLASPDNIPLTALERARTMDLEQWGTVAEAWRQEYYIFTKSVADGTSDSPAFASIDEHLEKSLHKILGERGLDNLWSAETVHNLSRVWHFLDPWAESAEGIARFNRRFATATLSNGNIDALSDMAAHGALPWTHILSSQMFGTYKPNPRVYLGAAERLSLKPEQCAMVAAHLNDLQAAKEAGYGAAVYVERPREEQWDKEKVEQSRREGWVDLWIKERENGFVAVAEQLGL